MGTLQERVAYLNQRFDRVEFLWLIGFQFTTLIAVIAALLNGYFR